eukprot:355323-Chlamydomonas_euryale.AAC.6
MHATSAAAERFNSTYGAIYTAERSTLVLGTDDKMASAHTMEKFSRYQQTAQPEIVTMRLMEFVDKSKGYLKRLRAAEVAALVAEGRTTRGHGRPRTNLVSQQKTHKQLWYLPAYQGCCWQVFGRTVKGYRSC